jgi:deazaflavin-dependent oxidoreductase (nitroreductase family)
MVPMGDREGASFCYVTTNGRRTGRPHTIEIWFGARRGTVYVLSGGRRSDWLLNLKADPAVTLRIGRSGEERAARARVVEDADENAMARRLLASKYQGWQEGRPLSSWARTAIPVAFDPA